MDMESSEKTSFMSQAEEWSKTTPAELQEKLNGMSPEQLLEYATKVTQVLGEDQKQIKDLSQRFDAAQNWAMGLTLVEEIGQDLSSTLDINEVLTRLLSRTYQVLDVEDGSVMLLEESTGDLVAQLVLGSVSDEAHLMRVPKGQGIAGEVALTGKPIIVTDAKSDPRHFSKIDEDTGFDTRSILCVPVYSQEQIIGVLEVFNKRNGTFAKSDEILLSSIANYAGIAIENARLHQSVIAERDRVIQAQEEVSHRLQRDLHDGPTQLVAAIQMGLEFTQKAIKHNEIGMAESELANMHEIATRASHQMRTMLFELRPLILETQGVEAALRMLFERRQAENKVTKLKLVSESDLPARRGIGRFEARIEATIFAIVQEAVTNALKHAKAQNLTVTLNRSGQTLTVTIADDGVGFDINTVAHHYEGRGSYGMLNLRERAEAISGEYSLDSVIGQGTTIQIKVPLSQQG